MKNKKLMLIVDDAEVNRRALFDLFQNEYEIIQAADGTDALKLIEQYAKQIAIILLDIEMPNMDGIAVLKWLKENKYVHLPVIVITDENKYQLEALKYGAWDFILQPTDNDVIKARVKNIVRQYALTNEYTRNQRLTRENREMANIINSLPGGIATYRIVDNRLETIYFSDGVAKLSGHTREEYEKVVGNDASAIMYEDDKKRIFTAAMEMLKNGKPIDETYRIHHKDGSLVWVRINGVIIDENNGIPIIHAVFQKSTRLENLYANLVSESKDIIYVCDTRNYDLLYVNQSGLAVLNKFGKEYTGKKCYEFLFGFSSPCPFCRMAEMRSDCFMERDFTFPINKHTYSLRGKLTDWNGLQAHVEYVTDVTEIREAELQRKEWTDNLQAIMDHIPGGMCVYKADASGFHPVVHNQAFFDIFGYSVEHQKEVLHSTAFLNVHPDDLDELKRVVFQAIKTDERVNHTYRFFNDKKNRYIWLNLNAVVIPQSKGEKLCYVSYTDVTAERENQNKLAEVGKRMEELKTQAQEALTSYQSLVNAVPGGIAQYEVLGNAEIQTKYFSDGLCLLTGYSKDERSQMSNENVLSLTYEPDRPLLKQRIKQAVTSNQNMELTYRIQTKSGTPKWVHLSAAFSLGPNGEKNYQAVFTDVDQLKKAEQELQDNQLRYSVAIKSAGVNVWEYDICNDSLFIVSNSLRIQQNCFTMEHYVETTVKSGAVRKDSIEAFLSMFEKLKAGEKEVTEDIWYRASSQSDWWCERITYTTAFDDSGKPVKAYGAGRDITREKEAEQKFYDEISQYKITQSDALSSLTINLTENRVVNVASSFKAVSNFLGESADNYFTETPKSIIPTKSQEAFRLMFNRRNLLDQFRSGNFVVPMEVTRTYDTNTLYWIRYNAHLIQNPDTKDVIAHISCIDITNEKVMQIIMDTVAKTDYDFFTVINGADDSARDYTVAEGNHLFDEHKSFAMQIKQRAHKYVCQEDVERVISECTPKNVWAKIKDGGTHKFSFSTKSEDGTIRRKQIQFTYIAPLRKTYLMSQIDVDDIYQAQEESKRKLEKALAAKSDFLSNVSHDMRTPMNGILGLLHLTLDMKGIPTEVYDNLLGIRDSSKYLLSLINDTLDMSKIESNKLTLEYETVNAAEFVKDIITYVTPLATEQGVSFNVIPKNAELEYILASPLRLRQIFVNIISNAIKFTPKGGKVDMIIECYKRENGIAYDRIAVKDNGIGMSKEFLPKIFEPFEQENPQLDGKNQGTGLGMPIVKKLVEMMGGRIEVFSEKNVGTEVVVWINFQRVYPTESELTVKNTHDLTKLVGKRILLAEDHPVNAAIATKLLNKKQVIVEVASNGKIAVELFQNSGENHFDAVLMDIRMPIMNGLEATRAIRAIDRKDAKTVPIIAMTANAFDDDVKMSREAGMNAHLAKPFEPETLYNTLSDLL